MAKQEQNPIPSIVKSVQTLLARDPHRIVSVEVAQFSFSQGHAFSGYAVNTSPNYSTLFNSDGSRFDKEGSTRFGIPVEIDELRNMFSARKLDVVQRENGFDIFPQD